MASQGPVYPGNVGTNGVAPEDANDWLTASNVGADDGSEAQITHATYDAGDISFRLRARFTNGQFTIPAGATIDGVVVEIDRRCFAGAARDYRVQLEDFGTLIGSNKATATSWPGTLTVVSYGGSTDKWGTTTELTPTLINGGNFAVNLAVEATAANTDIGVDFIRLTVYYTVDSSVTVTPGTLSLVTSAFTPTVTASDHKTATPGVVSLTLITFVPTVTQGIYVTPAVVALSLSMLAPTVSVSDHRIVTPGVAALSLTAFAPDVVLSDHKTVVPGVAALSVTPLAPVVTASDHKIVTPDTAVLVLTPYAPTATGGVTVTPAATALTTTAFAPDVILSDHKVVTPDPAALSLSTFAPTVTGGAGLTVSPGAAALSLTAFAPDVVLSDHKLVTPDPASLVVSAFAPTVGVSDHIVVTPGIVALNLATFAPTVTVGAAFALVGGLPPTIRVFHPLAIIEITAAPRPIVMAYHPRPEVS